MLHGQKLHLPIRVPVLIKRKRKRTLCPAALTSCPIPGRGGDSFECVDTKSDIESCKHFHNHQTIAEECQAEDACTIRTKHTSHPVSGIDRAAIPNIDEVACHRGTCQVRSRQRGFEAGQNGRNCETRLGSARKASTYGTSGFSAQI